VRLGTLLRRKAARCLTHEHKHTQQGRALDGVNIMPACCLLGAGVRKVALSRRFILLGFLLAYAPSSRGKFLLAPPAPFAFGL
jgi:hypothetical protein